MPGLVACNRRWGVGSDDFVFPGFAEIFIRVVWLITVAAVYSRQRYGFQCSYGHLLHTYCLAMLTILSIHLILSVIMITISMRGTVLNTAPRRRLPIVLYFKFFMLLPEFAVTLLGTLWAFDLETDCNKTVVFALRAIALSGWVVLACLLLGVGMVFDPLGSKKQNVTSVMMEDNDGTTQRLWKMRCKLLCCCVNENEHDGNAFNDIAQIIADYFKGLDVVVTDIAAGLILIQRKHENKTVRLQVQSLVKDQAQRHLEIENQTNEASSILTSIEFISDDPVFPHPQTWMTLPQAAHYMKFAAASYGWALYMYSHLSSGACKLYSNCRCCLCLKGSNYIMDDNCCGCNTAAIIKTTGIKEQDIVYATYHNRIYQVPFFVAVDHVEKAVIISIRGTLSLQDAITDLNVDSELLETPSVQGGKAHKGMLQVAQYIHQTITTLQLLNKAFDKAPGYQLVITGHSLGAGVASLLAILLKSDYPQLKCFAFSPPGWLLSLTLSRYTEDFICSVVVGMDLVPRLGILTMENLKSEILITLRSTNKPKFKILMGGIWNFLKMLLSTSPTEHHSSSESSARTSLIEENCHHSYTEEISNHDPEGFQDVSERSTLKVDTPLFLPGQVLYLEEIEPRKRCCDVPVYRAAWARAEMFDEILVSSKMIHDHMPDVVNRALDQLAPKTSLPSHQVYVLPNQTAVV